MYGGGGRVTRDRTGGQSSRVSLDGLRSLVLSFPALPELWAAAAVNPANSSPSPNFLVGPAHNRRISLATRLPSSARQESAPLGSPSPPTPSSSIASNRIYSSLLPFGRFNLDQPKLDPRLLTLRVPGCIHVLLYNHHPRPHLMYTPRASSP